MGNVFSQPLPGHVRLSAGCRSDRFSHWMRIQYQEETAHALKFYDFLLSRGGQVTMLSIDAPDANWSNILEILKKRCPTNRKSLAESTNWCILPRKNGISPRIFSCNGLSPNRWKRKKASRTSSANYAWSREKDRECWFWTRICQPAPLRRLPPTNCCYCSPSILRKRVPEKLTGEWRRNKISCGYKHKIGGMQWCCRQ